MTAVVALGTTFSGSPVADSKSTTSSDRSSTTERTALPVSCSGWERPEAATKLSEKRTAPLDEFTPGASAVYRFEPATTDNLGHQPFAPALTCGGFKPDALPGGRQIVGSAVFLSLAAVTGAHGDTTLSVEASFDNGTSWRTVGTESLSGSTSNADRGDYLRFALPFGITAVDLAHLKFRLSVGTAESFGPVTVYTDAVGLSLELREIPSERQPLFSFSDEPIILLDERSLDGYEILDVDGGRMEFETLTEVVEGGTALTLRPQQSIRPGTYIVRTTSERFFRTVTSEQRFSFGLLNLNLPPAAPEPGDLVPVAIGVLDDRGRTVCDAAVNLRITAPSGQTSIVATDDGSIVGSPECGAASITGLPDYRADFIALEQGTYRFTLSVVTDGGIEQIERTFDVEPAGIEPFQVERRQPTRINPKATYRSELRVTPLDDYAGLVTETLPVGFRASDVSLGGTVSEREGKPIIEWNVDWNAGGLATLSYVFDAPDISPALFTVEPLSVGSYAEPRSWTIVSDELVREEEPGLEYEPMPLAESDFVAEQPAVAAATKPIYDTDEEAQVKVYKEGYEFPAETIPDNLDSEKPLTVESVEIIAPDGSPDTALHVSEAFQEGEQAVEFLHLVPQRKFTPGEWRVDTTVTDGNESAIVSESFAWGVLVLNTRKSVYQPGELVEFAMGGVDVDGNTVCRAPMNLVITPPDGSPPTVLSSDAGTIHFSEECSEISITNTPDYSASFTPTTVGEYKLTLAALTDADEPYVVNEFLTVRDESAPFVITRSSIPSRVYPLGEYDVTLTVRPSTDFKGTFEELIPITYGLLAIGQDGASEQRDEQTTAINWQVDWRAGTDNELTYRLDPEDVSPALFLLGPASVGGFTELRPWRIASDIVSKVVDASASAQQENVHGEGRKLVFTTDTTGYIFYTDGTGSLSYSKTTDAGVSWAAAVLQTSQADTENFGLWYDRWTPGNTGTLIHVAFLENGTDDVYYDSMDTSGDVQRAAGEVLAVSNATTTHTGITDSVSITRATDGDLYIADSSSVASSVAIVRYSTDTGANWNDTAAEGLDDATGDYVMLLPQPAGDILLLRWDLDVDDIQSKEYEDGANSWDAGWTNIDTAAVESATYSEAWSASLNPATWEVYLAYVDNAGTLSATPDVRTATYNSTSWAAGTNVITDTNTIVGVATSLDTITGEMYVAYLKGAAAVSSVVVDYKVSTDGMATWSNERGPVVNLSTTVNGLQGNFASPYRVSVFAFDDALADIWSGDMADIGSHANALNVTNFQGFESQSHLGEAVAVVGTTSFSTTAGTFRSGAASLRTNPSSATGYVTHSFGYAATGLDPLTNYDNVSSVFGLRVASGTTINQQSIIYTVTDGTTVVAELSINANQTLSLTTGTDVNGAFALVDDTWYVIAFTYGIDFDVLEVGIYSSDMVTLHEDLTQSIVSATTVDRVRIGPQTASTTADLYFDDWMVNPNAITANFPLLRADYRIEHMALNAVGTDTGWTNTYTNLDEIPTVVSDADYVETQAATTNETSNLESAATAGISGSVLAVRLHNSNWESSAAATVAFNFRWREGGSTEVASSNDMGGTAAAPIAYQSVLTDEIGTTSLWDTTSLDALEVGVGSSTSETVFYRNGSAVVQVAFVPASTITVSGTCRNFADAADCTDPGGAEAIKVAIDGVVQGQTDPVVDGLWSIAGVAQPSRGQAVTVFIDGVVDTSEAVAVTRYDGSGDLTGVSLYQETLSLGSVDDQTIYNYDIARYDNGVSGDEDIFPDVDINAGNILTVDATAQSSTEKLTNLTGDTYKPFGNVVTHDFTMNAATNLTGITSPAWTVSGSWNKAAGTFSAGTSTITFTGTAENIDGAAATVFNNLTIDPASTGIITISSSNPQFNGLLTVALNDTLTINTGLTLQGNTASTYSIDGTINGAGTLAVLNSNLDADSGTLNSIVRFVAQSTPIVVPARTYGGLVELVNTAVADRTTQLGAGSPIFSGNLHVFQTGGNAMNVDGATNDPTVQITGNLDFTSTLGTITTGTNNWTVSGNVDLTSGTYTTEGTHTLIMNAGTSKTLTSAGNTLNNVTLAGVITLANETHTIAGDFSMAGGTITAGTSTVTMTGSKNLIGGGQTLANLTVNGVNTTVSLITSDLTVSATLTIGGAADGDNDTLDIGASRTLTSPAGATVTFVASGIDSITSVAGTGTLTVKHNNLDTDGTLSSVVRFDATDVGTLAIPQRTFGGVVEIYSNNSSINRTVDLGTAISQTITFSSDLNLIAANNNNITLGGATNNPAVNVTGNIDFTGAGSGTEIISSGAGVWTVAGNINLSDGTYTTAVNNELKMTSTVGKTLTVNGNQTIYKFTADPSLADTINVNAGSSTITVNNTLTVASGDTLDIDAGIVKWTGSTMTITGGTVSGAGTLTIDSATTIPTDGTISAITRYDASAGTAMTVPARTFNGQLEFYSNSGTARSVTLGGALILSGASSNFYVIADGASPGDLTVTAAVNDPAVTIGGSLDFTGSGTGTEVITTGAGTWSVAGSANLTDGTWTTEGTHKLVMNGTGTLTTDNETLLGLDINSSGTVTLAAATHTMTGNLLLGGSGTPTVTGSTISMTGSGKTIDGGGKTLNNLTLDGAGTTTLQNTDLTISGTLNVTTSDTFSLGAGVTLSHTGATFTFPDTATISGTGTLRFTDTSPGPGATGTLSSVVRFDATAANIATTTLDARTYGGSVEFYSNVAAVRSITFPTGTFTFSSNVTVITGASQSSVLTVDASNGGASNPTVGITGSLAYTKAGTATPAITTGTGAWTVSGNVNFTNGTFTATSGNTVTLNGSGTQTVTSATQSFYNLTLTNASGSFTGCGSPMTTPGIDFADAATVSNNYTITTQNVKVEYNATSTYTFQNINWNGVATNGVVFRSSAAGVWNLDINGTQTDVSYVTVAYSDATLTAGGVSAGNGTNTDCLNNTNWNFPVSASLSVSLDTNAINLGTLTPGTIAKGAVVLTVTAVATNGFTSHVWYDHKLQIDASNDVNDTTGGTITSSEEEFGVATSEATAVDITAWSPTNCTSTATTSNATALTANPQSFAFAAGSVTNDTTTLCFEAGITTTTAAGAYTSNATIVTTGKF